MCRLTEMRLVVDVRQRTRDEHVLLAVLRKPVYRLCQCQRFCCTRRMRTGSGTSSTHVLPFASRKSRSSMPNRILREELTSGRFGYGDAILL